MRKKLIEELQECVPKVLIICHSEASRIPSDIDLPLNAGTTTEDFESYCKNDNLNIDFSAYKSTYHDLLVEFIMNIKVAYWAMKGLTKLDAFPMA